MRMILESVNSMKNAVCVYILRKKPICFGIQGGRWQIYPSPCQCSHYIWTTHYVIFNLSSRNLWPFHYYNNTSIQFVMAFVWMYGVFVLFCLLFRHCVSIHHSVLYLFFFFGSSIAWWESAYFMGFVQHPRLQDKQQWGKRVHVWLMVFLGINKKRRRKRCVHN